MPVIEFHFTKPQSWIGEAIVWRTGDEFSHSWIVLDGVMYDPLPLRSKRHEPPINWGDTVIFLTVSEDEFKRVQEFCEDWVGTWYDFIGIFGWLIGIKELQHPNHTYCHEYLHEVVSMISGEGSAHKLISAKHLIDELTGLDVVVVTNN